MTKAQWSFTMIQLLSANQCFDGEVVITSQGEIGVLLNAGPPVPDSGGTRQMMVLRENPLVTRKIGEITTLGEFELVAVLGKLKITPQGNGSFVIEINPRVEK